MTSTHGIRKERFSKMFRSHSKPLIAFGMLAAAADTGSTSILFLTVSIAALANDPPVPFTAESAVLAVSSTACESVVLPLRKEAPVSDIAVEKLPSHLGSNQSALKSKREKTRTNRSIEPVQSNVSLEAPGGTWLDETDSIRRVA